MRDQLTERDIDMRTERIVGAGTTLEALGHQAIARSPGDGSNA